MITLRLPSTEETVDVQGWCDLPSPQDLPGVGEEVSLPVQVTAYVQAGVGKVRYSGRDAQPLGCS